MDATPRIASLVPSLTELVVALGLGRQLVARTGFCIHPAAAVRDVPKVGGTKDVNLDRLRRLAPTHVLVNVDENRAEVVEALRAWPAVERPEVVVTHPCAPEDVPALIERLAAMFGAVEGVATSARALVDELRDELQRTAPGDAMREQVLYLVWREPWMTVTRDTYIARLLARVGWDTLPATDGGAHGKSRYPALSGAEPWLADVRRVLLSSEPYRFDASHLDAARALCPNAGRVQLVDGEQIGWWGARTAAGLRYLRALAAEG